MVKRVLIFAAHPDDDLIGCGGSMAKHVKLGNQVSVCYMTSGEAASQDRSKEELGITRESEARNAAQLIGFQDITFLRNPDGYLQYNQDNLKKLTELIRLKQPNLVYVHHQTDAHQDHKATFQIVNEAVGRTRAPCFKSTKETYGALAQCWPTKCGHHCRSSTMSKTSPNSSIRRWPH